MATIFKTPLPELTEHHIHLLWDSIRKTAYCWVWRLKSPTISLKPFGPFCAKRVMLKLVDRPGSRRVVELKQGPTLIDLKVCNSCHNEMCVNPDHLFYGEAKDDYRYTARRSGRLLDRVRPEDREIIKMLRKTMSGDEIALE
jgi:hypothetical protein